MKILCGVDILSAKRFNQDIKKLGEPFFKKIFLNQELQQNTNDQLASIFCLKEAVVKAIGVPNVSWLEISTFRDKDGKVHCSFTKINIARKIISMDTSISHDNGLIIAMAVILLKN